MSRRRGKRWNEGRAVHVGVNRVDDLVYRGALPALSGAENDARAMRDFAARMGCASRVILGSEATRETVTAALESTIERLVPGDFLLVTYAGHMTTLRGVGDDPDGWDEAWCLYDGILIDDEFHDLLADAPEGVDVLVVTDSCFAAGVVDSAVAPPADALAQLAASPVPPDGRPTPLSMLIRAGGIAPTPSETRTPPGRPSAEGGPVAPAPGPSVPSSRPIGGFGPMDGAVILTPRKPNARLGDFLIADLVRQGAIPRGRARPASQRRPIQAAVLALAGAAEGELAFEGSEHGLLTAALIEIDEWLGDATVSYLELVGLVEDLLTIQRPALKTFGPGTAARIASPALPDAPRNPTRIKPT